MAFYSQYAHLIWDTLYNAYIPDQLTLNPDYVKKFGVYVSGNKNIDNMLSTNLTHVKIPVIKMLEYYDSGISIEIPSREDMINIHKDIEKYLAEWKQNATYAINNDLDQHKNLLLSLEKLSKYIYEKAKPREVIDNLFMNRQFAIVNPIQQVQEEARTVNKPDYEGISKLIKSKSVKSRFG